MTYLTCYNTHYHSHQHYRSTIHDVPLEVWQLIIDNLDKIADAIHLMLATPRFYHGVYITKLHLTHKNRKVIVAHDEAKENYHPDIPNGAIMAQPKFKKLVCLPDFPDSIYWKFDSSCITEIESYRIEPPTLEKLPLLQKIAVFNMDDNPNCICTNLRSLCIKPMTKSFDVSYLRCFPNLSTFELYYSFFVDQTVYDVSEIVNLTNLSSLSIRTTRKCVDLLLGMTTLQTLKINPVVTRRTSDYYMINNNIIMKQPDTLINATHLRHLDFRIVMPQSVVNALTNLESLTVYDFEEGVDLNCLENLHTLIITNYSDFKFRINSKNIAKLRLKHMEVDMFDSDAVIPQTVTTYIGKIPQKILNTMPNLTRLNMTNSVRLDVSHLTNLTSLCTQGGVTNSVSLLTNLTSLTRYDKNKITQEWCDVLPVSLQRLNILQKCNYNLSHLTNLPN